MLLSASSLGWPRREEELAQVDGHGAMFGACSWGGGIKRRHMTLMWGLLCDKNLELPGSTACDWGAAPAAQDQVAPAPGLLVTTRRGELGCRWERRTPGTVTCGLSFWFLQDSGDRGQTGRGEAFRTHFFFLTHDA